MAYVRALVFMLVMATVAVATPTIPGFGQNQLISRRSDTIEVWAPTYMPFSGGLIFGMGKARFVLGNQKSVIDVSTNNIEVRLTPGGALEVSTPHQGKDLTFQLRAHKFAVCPMAKHVRRRAAIAFTIPPYSNAQLFADTDMVATGSNQYIAREFFEPTRLLRLVRDADFWIEDSRRVKIEMESSIKKDVLDDVNRFIVTIPGTATLANGLTYFSGDFHTNAVILLNVDDNKAYVLGWPLAYKPVLIDGKIKIKDVELLEAKDGGELAKMTSYGPADFKSLFDLSLLFTAIRDISADKLDLFIKNSC